jgi:2,5-diketo-D-gluconate reductase A
MTYDATSTVTLTSGAKLPLVGFGTWQLRGDKAYRATRAALDAGYRHIDTATMYGNEAEVGRAIKDSGLDRADLYVTTKLPPERIKRARATLTESLSLLGLDRVDLWLIHWPPHGSPATEAWREFRQLRDEGMTTSIGVSNYDVDLIDELIAQTGEAPAVNQVPWSPSQFDAAALAGNRDRGTVLEGYSPLKNTNLRAKELFDISQAHGVTAAQVVLRWHVQHEIPVIPRSQNPERIVANFDLFGFDLTADEMARIDAMAI